MTKQAETTKVFGLPTELEQMIVEIIGPAGNGFANSCKTAFAMFKNANRRRLKNKYGINASERDAPHILRIIDPEYMRYTTASKNATELQKQHFLLALHSLQLSLASNQNSQWCYAKLLLEAGCFGKSEYYLSALKIIAELASKAPRNNFCPPEALLQNNQLMLADNPMELAKRCMQGETEGLSEQSLQCTSVSKPIKLYLLHEQSVMQRNSIICFLYCVEIAIAKGNPQYLIKLAQLFARDPQKNIQLTQYFSELPKNCLLPISIAAAEFYAKRAESFGLYISHNLQQRIKSMPTNIQAVISNKINCCTIS